MTKEKADAAPAENAKDSAPTCGLIMPISSTQTHDEKHWAAVQTLLHRGIVSAGFQPANVWEGVNDRISKRIVSNIFKQEIVVADISDLNPNVMLELGLRLASKKPTVVVFEKGGKIPFDINDVGALPYPGDLNILEMEAFFEKFTDLLRGRSEAFAKGTYEPYLGDVVVEVLEPQTKEVSIGEAVLERIEEIAQRMSRLEKQSSNPRAYRPTQRESSPPLDASRIYVRVPLDKINEFERELPDYVSHYSADTRGDMMSYELNLKGETVSTQHLYDSLRDLGATIDRVTYRHKPFA